MEPLSYKSYIDKLMEENFNFETFSPENCNQLFDVFKASFYRYTPYWKEETIDGNNFYIQFKKYGENRKIVFLKFSFISNAQSPRVIELTLTNDQLKKLNDTVNLSLSDIWKDHSILSDKLKEVVGKGLSLAEETN